MTGITSTTNETATVAVPTKTTATPATATPATATTHAGDRRPGALRALRLGLGRGVMECRQFFRSRAQMGFTFAMPVVMLLLLSSVFPDKDVRTGVTSQQVFTTGMLGVGVITTSLQSLAMQIAGERQNGTLKRLRGTPLPPAAYFLGKTVLVLVTGVCQSAVLLAVGRLFFGVRLPVDAAHWLTLAWVYLLGATACALLGIAYSNLVRGPDSGAVVILPLTVLQFVSGVFVIFSRLPHGLQIFASFFPLKWICQGMRSALLPRAYTVAEPAGGWEHGRTALILGAWAVGGLLLCLRTFRWRGRDDG